MKTTRATLLSRVRDLANGPAWEEFHALYAPLLVRYARALGLTRADADEVRDGCLALLSQRLPRFEYDRARGRFKSWLWRLARDHAVDLLRRRRPAASDTATLARLADPAPGPDELFEQEWRRQHLREALARACARVCAQEAEAFRLLLDDGLPVAATALRLGMTHNQVYKAKSRVLALVRGRLRALDQEA